MSILTQAVDSCPTAFIIIDTNGNIVETNKTTADIFGYKKEELIGLEIEALIPSEFYKTHKNHIKEFFKSPVSRRLDGERILQGVKKDGTKINVEVGINFFQNDDKYFGVANIVDVTDQFRMKKLLERTQEVAKIGSWQVDLKLNKCLWSKMTYQIHELDENEEVLLEEGINFYAPEHRPIIEKCISNCIETHEPWDVELKILTTKGEEKWVHAIGSAVFENNVLMGLEGTFQDIHERKLLKLEKEALLNKLIKTEKLAKIGHWEWNLNPESITWSKGLYEIWEQDPNLPPPSIEEHAKFIHPEDRDLFFKTLEEGINEKKAYSVNFRIFNNNKLKYIKGEGTPVWDESGQHIGFFGTAQDITNSKLQDLKQEELNTRLTLALEASNMGVWEWNLKTNDLIWDTQMYNLYGIQEEDFCGAYPAWEQGLHPDDKEASSLVAQKAVKGEAKFDIIFRVVWPNGEIREIKALADVVKDEFDNPIKMIGINWDITELNKQTRLIKESNERFELMTKGASVGIWDWPDINENKEHWSSKFYELLGYKDQEIEANLENFGNLLHPEDREKTFSMVDLHFKGESPFDLDYRLKTKNGDYKWFRGSGQVSTDKEGNLKRMVGSIQDIHDRVTLQEKLIKSNEELDQFAYIASHDLREPLRGMRNFSQFLIEDYSDKLDDDGKKYLKTIQKLGTRLEGYLDSLLYYSRLGREEVSINAVDFNELVDQAQLTHLDSSLKNFKINTEGKLPTIKCDPVKMNMVIGNLFQNAIRYNTKEEKIISIRGKEISPKQYQFWITDNGIGIKKEHWERIFIMFKRLHGKDEFESGTGLGLSAVKRTIEKHKGKIWVESSKINEGTTITFTLKENI